MRAGVELAALTACMRSRAQVTSIVYNKALVRINMADIPAAASEGKDADEGPASADMGKLVSLLSVDVERVEFLPLIITSACRTPLNIIIAGAFLYSILGYSAFVGYIMFFVVCVPPMVIVNVPYGCFRSPHSPPGSPNG